MSAHLYVSSNQPGMATDRNMVVFCQHCGRIAWDANAMTFTRIDKMQADAEKPCPLAPPEAKTTVAWQESPDA